MPAIPTKFEDLKHFVNTHEFQTIRDRPEQLMLCRPSDPFTGTSTPRSKGLGKFRTPLNAFTSLDFSYS